MAKVSTRGRKKQSSGSKRKRSGKPVSAMERKTDRDRAKILARVGSPGRAKGESRAEYARREEREANREAMARANEPRWTASAECRASRDEARPRGVRTRTISGGLPSLGKRR